MDKKSPENNIQDVVLSAKCGCKICTTLIYWRTAKLYFQIQFKNQNIQILNNKCPISTFPHWVVNIYYFILILKKLCILKKNKNLWVLADS